jgi:arylsulfatase A
MKRLLSECSATRRLGIAGLLGLLLLEPLPTPAQNRLSNRKPNIIYILVDDLGYGDVNFNLPGLDRFNNPNLHTPHLAQLAQKSLVFTNHYASSPVCSPSRAGLMTGRTPTRTNIGLFINDLRDNDKVFLRGQEYTLAELLRDNGYATAIFGKWHLNGADWQNPQNWKGWTGSFPQQQGFEHGIVSKENPHFTTTLEVNTQKDPGDFYSVAGEPLGPIKGYTSDILTTRALAWIKSRTDKTKPFFAYLPYDAVHIRVSAADKYVAMYDTGNPRMDAYYANISHLDAAIGRLVDELKKQGLAENTLLLFSSDNGPDVLNAWEATAFCYGTSYPLQGEKYQLYEGGIRVPGFAYWPGTIKPGVSDEPNSTLDVMPTLVNLLGGTPPKDIQLDGESILPLLLNTGPVSRKQPMYWQFDLPRDYPTVVGEGYQRRIDGFDKGKNTLLPRVKIRRDTFTLYGLSDKPFSPPTHFKLFNLSTDPTEQRELPTEHPAYAGMVKEMMSKYKDVEQERLKTENWISANAPTGKSN